MLMDSRLPKRFRNNAFWLPAEARAPGGWPLLRLAL
jgi:hypothetical protein